MNDRIRLAKLNALANNAETAWTDAIRKAFPREHPGDVRYIRKGQGESGTPLRFAYIRRMECVKLWSNLLHLNHR